MKRKFKMFAMVLGMAVALFAGPAVAAEIGKTTYSVMRLHEDRRDLQPRL